MNKIKRQDLEVMEIEFANLLYDLGYTDGVDVSPEISLLDYNMLRNPDNSHCIFYKPRPGKHGFFEYSIIRFSEVRNYLKQNCEKSFFESMGMNLDDYLRGLDNCCLALVIDDINHYYGDLKPSPLALWNTPIDEIVKPAGETVKLRENQNIVKPTKEA